MSEMHLTHQGYTYRVTLVSTNIQGRLQSGLVIGLWATGLWSYLRGGSRKGSYRYLRPGSRRFSKIAAHAVELAMNRLDQLGEVEFFVGGIHFIAESLGGWHTFHRGESHDRSQSAAAALPSQTR